jgi:hypothetical protein
MMSEPLETPADCYLMPERCRERPPWSSIPNNATEGVPYKPYA